MPTLTLPLPPKSESRPWYIRVERLQDCDLCPTGHKEKARYDALVPSLHTWAYICETHAHTMHIRLGMGRGQLLLLSGEALPD